MKFLLLITYMSVLQLSATAQKMVESGTYNLMLKTLLSHNVKEVSVKDAVKTGNAVFIDSREKQEYNISHIKDAVWVGYSDFDISRMDKVPRTAKVIVYCSVGKRSEEITEKLKTAGYPDVSNLYGGIFEWINEGYPVYKDGKKTNKIHAYSKVWGIWLNKGEKVYK